ncbi:MAG: hypothetical protein IT440_01325, partial [Phycisphaeraceae bacterium]|nr:hypothetical protein [Phycisphaeraceae bacterium]
NQRLLAARSRRKQPGTDDKVLAAWNGLMLAGLAETGRVLGESRYLDAAKLAAEALIERLVRSDGSLLRTFRGHQAKVPAFLEDYAHLVHGLLALRRATREPRWLELARQLTDAAISLFSAENGGYYDTLAGQDDLLVRTRSCHDGAMPSGNSQMVHNLLDLAAATGDSGYADRAIVDLRAASSEMTAHPMAMLHMHHALLGALEMSAMRETPVSSQPSRRQAVQLRQQSVRWTATKDAGDLSITLEIGREYHLTAHDATDAGQTPLSLVVEPADQWRLDVQYPASLTKRYPLGDQPQQVHEGEIQLSAHLTRLRDDAAAPRVTLTYQTCTDQSCLLPRTVELPLE